MADDGFIYRLPPDKKYPKGLRVRKTADTTPHVCGTLVSVVKDGYMVYTKCTLTKEG